MDPLALAVLFGYLAGSVPFGLVLTKMAGLGDIRQIGSGNIGATNVLRTGNKGLAVLTLLLDSCKGAAAALIFGIWAGEAAAMTAGFAAVLGHNFPIWLRFKGGKGVATSFGVLLVAAWPVGVAACLTWLATAAIFRISSLAALVAFGFSPFVALAMTGKEEALLALGLALLGFVRHRANIVRLFKGQEPKIGAGKINK
ncbi:MAG TPA: glycerol-3-phosphate 1-O-acyltransferase PlsY [Rhodospirillaceae bacterium]|nr:glycerol-3-phosphate 1-O-acyltransferase PlsY [Rhodospirillaceae bacterium]